MAYLSTAAKWFGRWLFMVLAICLAGALAGGLLFPLFGHLLGMDLGTGEMIRNGIHDGAFLALIWAPGISFVACLMLARRHKGKC
jgi:hypothetical protein